MSVRARLADSVPHVGWVPFRMMTPPDLRDEIMREASANGLTGAAYVRMILTRHFRRLNTKG